MFAHPAQHPRCTSPSAHRPTPFLPPLTPRDAPHLDFRNTQELPGGENPGGGSPGASVTKKRKPPQKGAGRVMKAPRENLLNRAPVRPMVRDEVELLLQCVKDAIEAKGAKRDVFKRAAKYCQPVALTQPPTTAASHHTPHTTYRLPLHADPHPSPSSPNSLACKLGTERPFTGSTARPSSETASLLKMFDSSSAARLTKR